MNMKQWKDKIIADSCLYALPIVTFPGLHLTGKKVIDVVTNGQEQANCIEALAKRYNSLAGVMVMDLSVEAEAFGSSVIFSDNDVPTIGSRLLSSHEDITALSVPKPGDGRTSEYLKAAQIASERITDRPVFAGIIGPYSLAGRLFDITEMMTLVYIEPEAAHELMDKCTTFLAEYAKAYKSKGASGVIIAEPAAGLLAPDICHEFSSVYVKAIVDAVQDDDFMVVLHNCGNTVTLVPSMLTTGAMAYHFGNAVDMSEILPQIPDGFLAMGNIDPAGTIRMGNPETVKAKTIELLDKCAGIKTLLFHPAVMCHRVHHSKILMLCIRLWLNMTGLNHSI
jgi:uroporphyrinogen decarboxylase